MSRAYTVASLAEEWECSPGVIRKAIADGRLGHFRIGTLIRIPVEEVRRFECQTTPCNDSAAASRLSGERTENASDGGFRPLTALERKLRQGGFGRTATVHPGLWGES